MESRFKHSLRSTAVTKTCDTESWRSHRYFHKVNDSECKDNASNGHNHNQQVADNEGDTGTRRAGDTLLVYNIITFR